MTEPIAPPPPQYRKHTEPWHHCVLSKRTWNLWTVTPLLIHFFIKLKHFQTHRLHTHTHIHTYTYTNINNYLFKNTKFKTQLDCPYIDLGNFSMIFWIQLYIIINNLFLYSQKICFYIILPIIFFFLFCHLFIYLFIDLLLFVCTIWGTLHHLDEPSVFKPKNIKMSFNLEMNIIAYIIQHHT